MHLKAPGILDNNKKKIHFKIKEQYLFQFKSPWHPGGQQPFLFLTSPPPLLPPNQSPLLPFSFLLINSNDYSDTTKPTPPIPTQKRENECNNCLLFICKLIFPNLPL